jgi:hypothetical protein
MPLCGANLRKIARRRHSCKHFGSRKTARSSRKSKPTGHGCEKHGEKSRFFGCDPLIAHGMQGNYRDC